MSHFLAYALPGIPYGCVFALLAVGLVLTYNTTGVLNLAFGAQAYVSALAFYVAIGAGFGRWWSFVLAVLLLSAALGLVLERSLFRFVRSAPVVVGIVSALGLLIAIPGITVLVFGSGERLKPPALVLDPVRVYAHLGSVPLNGIEISTTAVTVLTALGLAALYRLTPLGLQMRAVVESPRLAELEGVNSARVSSVSWVLSSLLAGLAGVMLAPLYAQLSVLDFTGLLVGALAAAAAGGFTSLPLTLAGGIALGIAQQVIGAYLPSGSVLANGLEPSLPFLVLIVLLVALPGFRRKRELSDPMASCDPPAAPLAASLRTGSLNRAVRIGGLLLAVAFLASALTWVSGVWLFVVTEGIVLSVIFLSVTVLTGMSGQISLCQATFAGVGAFAAGQLGDHLGLSVFAGIAVGAVLAAALGALIAVPTLRMGAMALAVATLAFALLADNILFPLGWVGNGAAGVTVARPQLGPISFQNPKAFFVLALVVLVVCAAAVHFTRRGTAGRFLAAMDGSSTGAAATGVNVSGMRVAVFAFSAAIAGAGGALYGSLLTNVSSNDFVYELSLVFVVIVVTTGARTIEGAIQAGMAYAVIQQLLTYLPSRFAALLPVVFGLGALTYARHPEGAVEFQKRLWTRRLLGLLGRAGPDNAATEPGAGGAGAGGTTGADGAGAAGAEDARALGAL